MTHSIVKFGLPLLAALGAGCTTMGIGSGATPAGAGADSVRLGWKNSDSVAGTLGRSLSDGEAYSGQLFQLTRDTTVNNVGPLWTGWHLRWGGSGGLGDSVPVTGFTKHYPITDRTTSPAVVPDALAGDARCTVTAFSVEAEADAQDLGNASTPLAPVTNWGNCGAEP